MNLSSLITNSDRTSLLCEPPSRPDYSWDDLVHAVKLAGVCLGDVVFFQLSHASLGHAAGSRNPPEISQFLYSALCEAVGPHGTMLLPAFSLSFLNHQDFDLQRAPIVAGSWSASRDFLEYFLRQPGVVRSQDPNFSVAGFGPRAEELLTALPHTSFGKGSVHDRLLNAGARLCIIGGDVAASPYIHFAEECTGSPYLYKKLFTGNTVHNGTARKQAWISTVRIASAPADADELESLIRSAPQCRVVPVGQGEVASIDCRGLYEVVSRYVGTAVWRSTTELLQLEDARTAARNLQISLPVDASFKELIDALWMLPRDIISDGYDTALRALAAQLPVESPMVIHEYPSGTECWTWIVPEKWSCRGAWLETTTGVRLFSYEDNPLHVVSYSLPINREVSRQELFQHLHVHPELPDAIPFIFKYYERDWGLCCSAQLKQSLQDESYRVVIQSDFSFGTLKVGEVLARGKLDKTFVFCAHLCHPAMVNDDLSGVLVGINVMQALRKRQDLRYTYRLLILPETIGSVAYLSHHEALIPDMIGGLFLEMLGLDNPHALQMSFAADTTVDRYLEQVLKDSDPQAWIGPFRTVVGNDERQFNAPGVRVPMLSLSRVCRQKPAGCSYYPQYHSSHDNPEITSVDRLAESVELVLKMIDAVEGDQVPVNCFKGEIFCSGYGLHIDAYSNPEGNRALFDIMFLIDGTRSLAEIARICNISTESVRGVVHELTQLGLVRYAGSETS